MKLLSEWLIIVKVFCVISFVGSIDNTNDTKLDKLEERASTSLDPLKDPCELLSSKEIESIDGFKKSSDGSLHKASGDTYKQCDFLVDKNQLSIVFRRLSQKEIDLKKLESGYEFYLKQDAYSEVQNVPGDQAIYSHNTKTTPSGTFYSYLLQWRYGNHTEHQIGITYSKGEQNPDDILKALVVMANKLEN